MEILFSTRFGSHLYGTNTPTSDVDMKYIYLPSLDDMLIGKKAETKVVKTNTVKNTRNSAEDIDEEFIPVQQFARHFVEGQTYALELAYAYAGSLTNHAGQEVADTPQGDVFKRFCNDLVANWKTSNVKAMVGYVMNQANIYSFKGERLNAATALHAFVDDLPPEKTFGEAIADPQKAAELHALTVAYPTLIRNTQYDIGSDRTAPCTIILEKTIPHTNTVRTVFTMMNALLARYGDRAKAASATNVDWKAVMHAVRIADEGIAFLKPDGGLKFPLPQSEVDYLLSIKRGEFGIDTVYATVAAKLEELLELSNASALPKADGPFLEQFNGWLAMWMRQFYKVGYAAN